LTKWRRKTDEDDIPDCSTILISSASALPDPKKANSLGEDAYFISPCGRHVGVADGVGGWRARGVDSGLFSRLLMSYCCQLLEESNTITSETALSKAFRAILHEQQLKLGLKKNKRKSMDLIQGTATVLVASLEGKILKVCSVGDCQLCVLRKRKTGEYYLVGSTQPGLFSFNMPHQMGLECIKNNH